VRVEFLVTPLEVMALRDLDDIVGIGATCVRCPHVWLQRSALLFLKVHHRNNLPIFLYQRDGDY